MSIDERLKFTEDKQILIDNYNFCIDYFNSNSIGDLENLDKVLIIASRLINDYYFIFNEPELNTTQNAEEKLYDAILKKLSEDYKGKKLGDLLVAKYLENDMDIYLNKALSSYIICQKYRELGLKKYPIFSYDPFAGGSIDDDLNIMICHSQN